MKGKKNTFSEAWQKYEKVCDYRQPLYHHYTEGYKAGWKDALSNERNRAASANSGKVASRKPPKKDRDYYL